MFEEYLLKYYNIIGRFTFKGTVAQKRSAIKDLIVQAAKASLNDDGFDKNHTSQTQFLRMIYRNLNSGILDSNLPANVLIKQPRDDGDLITTDATDIAPPLSRTSTINSSSRQDYHDEDYKRDRSRDLGSDRSRDLD